tara:strand:- start:126 stop:2177 length:2052 start_codon:yes stop_codon:yes gene_type:complete
MKTTNQLEEELNYFTKRSPNSHKGHFGHLAIIAGSDQMLGAAILAAKAAFATGVGYVSLITVNTFKEPLQLQLPELMVYTVATKNGQISLSAFNDIKTYCEEKKVSVIAIGPGLGQSLELKALIEKIIFDFAAKTGHKVVVDADAINQIDGKKCKRFPEGQMVLTPHPGEFNRLCDPINVSYNELDRVELATRAQEWTKQIILLKGHKTVVAGKGKQYINQTGNPSMATAGSGDVLTGIIGSMLAQGLTTFKSACLSSYLHGKGGDSAHEELGIGLQASDIISHCKKCLGQYEQVNIDNWHKNFQDLNEELEKLIGFHCFDEKKVAQTLANPALFSIGFEKEKGKGYLYGQQLARYRQNLFNLLDLEIRKKYFLLKCNFFDLAKQLAYFLKLEHPIVESNLEDVIDIGMGHSVYLVTEKGGKKAVVKEVDKKHPKVYYNLLEALKWPTLDIDYIENELGQWIISEYLVGDMLTESNIKHVINNNFIIKLAQQAACADMFGRGDRHLENYIWSNNNIYPVDISYLFWPENEEWVNRYIKGGQSEYCVIVAATNKIEQKQYKELFWNHYSNTMFELVDKKEQLYNLIENYYKNGDALRFKAYINRVIDKPEVYIEKQIKGYEQAFNIFLKRFKYKKKLEKKAHENPAFVENHPLMKMYHDSNQDRLTAFFLMEYHRREEEVIKFL